MKIINLTPHMITIVGSNNEVVAQFPSEGVARATQSETTKGNINGIPIKGMTFGEVINLPEYQEGVCYIVSRIVAEAAIANGRRADDLLLTALPVRDEAGRIIGCQAFSSLV